MIPRGRRIAPPPARPPGPASGCRDPSAPAFPGGGERARKKRAVGRPSGARTCPRAAGPREPRKGAERGRFLDGLRAARLRGGPRGLGTGRNGPGGRALGSRRRGEPGGRGTRGQRRSRSDAVCPGRVPEIGGGKDPSLQRPALPSFPSASGGLDCPVGTGLGWALSPSQ